MIPRNVSYFLIRFNIIHTTRTWKCDIFKSPIVVINKVGERLAKGVLLNINGRYDKVSITLNYLSIPYTTVSTIF